MGGGAWTRPLTGWDRSGSACSRFEWEACFRIWVLGGNAMIVFGFVVSRRLVEIIRDDRWRLLRGCMCTEGWDGHVGDVVGLQGLGWSRDCLGKFEFLLEADRLLTRSSHECSRFVMETGLQETWVSVLKFF